MSATSSNNESEYSHRQGSIMTLIDEDDEETSVASNLSTVERSQSIENGKTNVEQEYQTVTVDLRNVPDVTDKDNRNQSSIRNYRPFDDSLCEPLRSEKIYFDPNPDVLRKPQMVAPLLYKQNIKIKFLKPPPIEHEPLIIREVRPPQPELPPPLVMKHQPPPPRTPSPVVLREKPPKKPPIITRQIITKLLPSVPLPARSVIVEKFPPLPTKPRDVIIERWIPYEAIQNKRKVIVERAEPVKPYPKPKNVLILYDKIEAQVIRHIERLDISIEDPDNYSKRYGDSLLDTDELLEKIRKLGITEDISPPNFIDKQLSDDNSCDSYTTNDTISIHTQENRLNETEI